MQGSVWELCCSLSICLNVFWFGASACFAYDKTHKSTQGLKSAFEDQSEENSVWIIKWTTLLGIFCKISFTPAVTSCYHVHADAHVSAALVCYLDATGAETSMLLTAYCRGGQLSLLHRGYFEKAAFSGRSCLLMRVCLLILRAFLFLWEWVALFHCYYKVMQKCRLNFPALYVANHEKVTKNVLHVTYAILGSTSGA